MSIPAVNLSYVGQGPTANGQTIADQTSGPKSKVLVGYGTATLDGSLTAFTINWVDGSKTPFGAWSGPAGNQALTAAAPFAAFAQRIGATGDTAADSTTVQLSDTTTTGATITISAAGSNGHLLSFLVYIIPYSS